MRARIVVFVALSLLFAVRASAQCRVEGAVHSVDGAPLAGATVEIEVPDQKKPLTTVTDADGRYAFEGIKAGSRIRLLATHGGRAIAQAYPLVSLWVEQIDLDERPVPDTPVTVEDVLAGDVGPSGEVAGIVRTPDGQAVPGARLRLGDTPVTTATDSSGRFAFARLRPGVKVRLSVEAEGLEESSSDITVPSNSRTNADFTLSPIRDTEVTGAELPVLQSTGDSSGLAVDPAHVTGLPSLNQGDVFRTVQFVPGVAGAFENLGEFYVRRGTADQTLINFDGMTLYEFPTTYGAFSPFNSHVVQRTDLQRSPYGATEGSRLGGSVGLAGVSSTTGKMGGYADVSMLGLSGGVSVPLSDKGSIVFAGRTSPMDSLYQDVLDLYGPNGPAAQPDRVGRYSFGSFKNTDVTAAFHDINVHFGARVSPKDRVTASYYDARDRRNYSRDFLAPANETSFVPSDAVQLPDDALVHAGDVHDFRAKGWSGAWRRQWSPAASTEVSVGHSDYETSSERAWLLTSESTGLDYSYSTGRGGSSGISEANTLKDTTIRAQADVAVGFQHALSFGGEVVSIDTDYASLTEVTIRGRNGIATGSRLEPLYGSVDSGRLLTAFAQDAWRPLARLVVTPGVRITNYDLSSETFFDPRVGASYQVNSRFKLTGGWAIDHQAISRLAREDRYHGDGQFWALSNGTTIPVASVMRASGGFSMQRAGMLFEVEGYYKSFENLTTFAPRLFPGTAPTAGQSMLHVGTGTANGVDLLFQRKVENNTFWAGYSVGRVEYTYPTLQAATFAGSQDQQHELKLADVWRFRGKWAITGGWVLGSGRPYTPAGDVVQVWFPTGATVYDVTWSNKNSARLPAYHRLDVSTQRDFTMGRALSTLGVTVFNVYDRDNVLYRDYETANDQLVRNDTYYMGRALNAFFKLTF